MPIHHAFRKSRGDDTTSTIRTEINSLKGRNKIAESNALGFVGKWNSRKPRRGATTPCYALTGLAGALSFDFPGRCPGLICCAPLGRNVRTEWARTLGATAGLPSSAEPPDVLPLRTAGQASSGTRRVRHTRPKRKLGTRRGCPRLRFGLVSLLLWPLLAAASVHAQDADAPAPSLDEQLLEQLGDPASEALEEPSALDEQLLDELGEGEDIGEQTDPMVQIARRMQRAQQLIASRDTSEPTRRLQQQIAAELEELIEQVKKKKCAGGAKSGAGSSQPKPGAGQPGENPSQQPPTDSQTGRTDTAHAEAADPNQVRQLVARAWGHLPPQIRRQLEQAALEEFLPQYENLIEQYFNRLAEDQGAGP